MSNDEIREILLKTSFEQLEIILLNAVLLKEEELERLINLHFIIEQ
jgi:hypothetical protein